MEWLASGNFWYVEMFLEPSFWIGTFIFCIIAYLIGSINGGQILSNIGSKNLGETGSKNFGATNAGRVYGAHMFVFVFLFDMLKSVFVAIILTAIVTKGTFSPLGDPEINDWYLFYYASIPLAIMFVIIGHSFPIYFKFKGGKGVSSGFGCLIVTNWLVAIIAISIFGITLYITRWTSWASILGVISGCLLSLTLHIPMMNSSMNIVFFYWTYNWLSMIVIIFMGTLIIYRHKSNITRMIQGKDPFIKPKGYKKEIVDG